MKATEPGPTPTKKITNYFKPKFLLGMTATPERTDGFDIFTQFNHKIAYEIRLHHALTENMLCPFHYYGVSDISVNGETIREDAAFNLLVATERVAHIIEKAKFYGTDTGTVRGLVFCSKIDEAKYLSEIFNRRGYNTVALIGSSTEFEREKAIQRLENEDDNRLNYIFTVDIFNEGVDIPKVNQIIMLRPTQSAIVFVQQLGRGLRKVDGKNYLTVIDFIGNYANNYLIPIALFGDRSHNKDRLRKLLSSGSHLIPGSSTIDFDEITKERLYTSINSANLNRRRDLDRDYDLLKFELGREPMMMDFVDHGSRDPYSFVQYSKSYFSYASIRISELAGQISAKDKSNLDLLATHVADGKRIEEIILLKKLLEQPSISKSDFQKLIESQYGYQPSNETIESCISNINFSFSTATPWENVDSENGILKLRSDLINGLKNSIFRNYYTDCLRYAEVTFNTKFNDSQFIDGFFLYEKYSRKDVLRILNWKKNVVLQNIGGYITHPDKSAMPIFVTYNKDEHIPESVKYEDEFKSKS